MFDVRGVMWFREDLRIDDNTALFQAASQCRLGVIGIFIIDPALWKKHFVAPCRIEFELRVLQSLSHLLNQIHVPLMILQVKKTSEIPKLIFEFMETVQAKALFFNKQYEVNESARDNHVEAYFKKNAMQVFSYDDQTILPPFNVLTAKEGHFSIFTAYKNAWKKEFSRSPVKLLKKIKPLRPQKIKSTPVPNHIKGFQSIVPETLWPGDHLVADKKLSHFIKKHIDTYDKGRDFPGLNQTSRLSPYLAAGVISPRKCFLSALTANHHELYTGNKGTLTWLNELIWRDFYKHILIHVPRVSKNQAYKLETEKLAWSYDDRLLSAWQQGKTGFPIVDAAMRQLNQTGWMHNRLRMIVAMFLSKNLFLDWRLGEQYFMAHLIDGDLSANNGGWQWSASTGTDAAPYFRIFNPILQSQRYDPKGTFIREYCPELKVFSHQSIHAPHFYCPDLAKQCHYPVPIVDLSTSRKKTLSAFKSLKQFKK